MIEAALKTEKVFIVLDDITEENQLVALLGTRKINPQSKIIITSREKDAGDWLDVEGWSCQKFSMKLLNADESLKLLSQYVSKSMFLLEGFKELAAQAVEYCGGNPLALEVLGSSLRRGNTIQYWSSQLKLLENDIDKRVQTVLISSYKSLPNETVQQLFLHIACFFVGEDKDYVEKILEPDYYAVCGIETLSNRCLLSVAPTKKLMMHRLIQEMGKNLVRQESPNRPEEWTRVWHSPDSYKILIRGKGSKTIEGLALDMTLLDKENFRFKGTMISTRSLNNMDNLRLLQLNYAEVSGSYDKFSEDLRWLCWLGFSLPAIPSDLYMGNLVALNMSYSNLIIFEPPTPLESLQILNLKDSHNLSEIRNISLIPNLETLNLWNCYSLACVSPSIGDLKSLAILNMTGCKFLFAKQPSFSFPCSLQRLYLDHCNLECNNYALLSFRHQLSLQYLNLGGSLFESLPSYEHLNELRILDLSYCLNLKELACLPDKLEELYVDYCESLETISFKSHQFTLQEFGYNGCINLSEVECFMKLVPIAKLDETDLGHMNWLRAYENHEVCLVGDDALTVGRSKNLQMLYEFDIMSTSLPEIKDPNLTTEYISESPWLLFKVPPCPENRRLKGLNVTFKYILSGEHSVWFVKIRTTRGDDLIYNPKLFGKPASLEVGIWLSYWPIGNKLGVGDEVAVYIIVVNGLEVCECGASLVYADDDVAYGNSEHNMGNIETLGKGDFSRFQLSRGRYYLCRRDFFDLLENHVFPPMLYRMLVGDDVTEIRGWRKTGRPNPRPRPYVESRRYLESTIVGYIIHGPESIKYTL